MRDLMIVLVVALLIATGLSASARAETATWEQAYTVAQNWIALLIHEEGSWGGAETAHVEAVHEFRRGGRMLGYLCRVQPQGYIVVSLDKKLAPVKTFSETSHLDPESEEGMEDVLKQEMERALDEIDRPAGKGISIQSANQRELASDAHRSTWQTLTCDVQTFTAGLESGIVAMNYDGGSPPLLTSSWHQGDPYNRKCPEPGFFSNCSEARCSVGCTALAGAQIMRYWAWPPGYDWANMPDSLTGTSPATQINAVAKLCHDVGVKAGATYCISGFGCQTFVFLAGKLFGADLLDAFEDHFRYSDTADEDVRITESATEWFNYFKEELSLNRPVPYELGTGLHVVVCDGWKKVGSDRYLHLNYGWGGYVPQPGESGYSSEWNGYSSSNTWFLVDDVPNSGMGEHIIRGLYPEFAVWSIVTGNIVGFDYRYFTQDTVVMAADALFMCPNGQFLPGVDLTVRLGQIRFALTRLFSIKGTSTASIKLKEGAIVTLHEGARIRFH